MNRDEGYNKIQERITINDNGCHIWQGAKNDSGYGVQKVDGKFWYTHRFIYDYIRGIDVGMTVDHMCKNILCCNIEHLQLLTHKENSMQGSIESGRRYRKLYCDIHKIERTYNKKARAYKCSECNREGRVNWTIKSGYDKKNNEFNKEYNKQYREKNKERIKQYKLEYFEKNRDIINKKRREKYLLTGK